MSDTRLTVESARALLKRCRDYAEQHVEFRRNGRFSCWYSKGEQGTMALAGVDRVLRERAWNDYDFAALKKRRCKNSSNADVGSLVHNEIELTAKLGIQAALQHFASVRGGAHRITRALLSYLAHENFELIDAEVCVFNIDRTCRIGSAIDLVCLNLSTGKLALVELKTGGESYDTLSTGVITHPNLQQFQIQNNAVEHAKMQLIVYFYLFQKCYGHILPANSVANLFVLFVGTERILDADISTTQVKLYGPYLLSFFSTATPGTQRKRTKK
jgi:hypothetical protein